MSEHLCRVLVAVALVGLGGCHRPASTVAPVESPGDATPAAVAEASAGAPTMVIDDDYACVLEDGDVRCWGDDVVLPRDTDASPEGLVTMPVVGARSIAASTDRFCAIDAEGLLCWGQDSTVDEPALESDDEALERVEVPADPVEVRSSDTVVCVRDGRDQLTCWIYVDPSDYPLDDMAEYEEIDPPFMRRHEIMRSVVDFDPGTDFVCAITHEGRVECWGSDPVHYDRAERELGECYLSEEECDEEDYDAEDCEGVDEDACDLEELETLEAAWDEDQGVVMPGIPRPRSIAAGSDFVCVLTEEGRVYCWGEGSYGQLGGGAPSSSLGPAPVLGLDDAVAIDVGGRHACAVREGGGVVCWGDNALSTVGGRERVVERPRPVPGIEDAVDVVLTWNLSCAITRVGTPQCWGDDSSARVRGRRAPERLPAVELEGAKGLMTMGRDTCALREDDSVWCWGRRNLGAREHLAAKAEPGPSPHSKLKELHGLVPCGLSESGALRCWKSGTQMFEGGPTVLVDSEVVTADAGPKHVCAVKKGGEVLCWVHDRTRPPAPEPVTSVGAAIDVAVGDTHACAVRRDHAVECWALGARLSVPPQRLARATDAASIVSQGNDLCVVTSGGRVQCWAWARLGDPPYEQALEGVEALAEGTSFWCALAEGRVHCWGDNRYGQLGPAAAGRRSSVAPVEVEGLEGVVEVVAGPQHACARERDGDVRCWGRGLEGELGVLPPSRIERPLSMFEPGFLVDSGAPGSTSEGR